MLAVLRTGRGSVGSAEDEGGAEFESELRVLSVGTAGVDCVFENFDAGSPEVVAARVGVL